MSGADGRDAGAHLQRLVDLLPLGTVYVDGDRLRLNHAVESMTGYTSAELPTLDTWFAALHGADASAMRAFHEADRANGFPAPRRVVMRRKDGTERHVEFCGRREGDVEVWGMQDVTDRARAEATLRLVAEVAMLTSGRALPVPELIDAVARLCVPRVADACAVDLLLDGRHDRHVGATNLSPERERLFETLLTRSSALGPGTVLRRTIDSREPALVSHVTDEVYQRFAAGDAETLALARTLGVASMLFIPMIAAGEVIGAVMFYTFDPARAYDERDVELLRELVAPLAVALQNAHLHDVIGQYAEERLALLNNIPDPAWMKDRAGRYVAVNAAYCRATRRSIDEILGNTSEELYDADRAARYRAQDEQALAAGHQVTIADEYIDGEGRTHALETVTAPYHDRSGRVAGIVGIAHDVTERRQLEDQFRQAQKMEAVGRLAGGVAHDFNNLLTVISGSADFLLADLPREDPRREDALEIKRTALRGAALTRQLLTFSRRQVVQARHMSLSTLVRDAQRMLARVIGEDVRLEIELADELPPVHADPGLLEQALLNLVLNARDAMPAGGRLTIATRRQSHIAATGEPARDRAALVVGDTGVGMDGVTRDRIFEPFFTTKEPGRGTGLGLAAVFGIVNQAGGSVVVDSAPGAGSTFTLLLPFADAGADDAPTATATRAIAGASGETLLLIEDEPTVRRLTRRALEELGYVVLTAGTPSEALAASAKHPGRIDLVVADVVLPEGSGREAVDALTLQRPGLRALFISGYAADELVQHRIAEHGTSFLAKPFTVDGLAAAVRSALG